MRILLTIHHALDADTGAPGATLALRDAYRAAGHEANAFSFDDLPRSFGPRARELLFPEAVAAHLAVAAQHYDVVDASSGDGWLWALWRRPSRWRGVLGCRSHGLEHTFWDQAVREAEAAQRALGVVSRIYHGGVRLREGALSMRLADLALFLSAEDRERAIRELGVRPDRAHVVANGIPSTLAGLPLRPGMEGARIAHLGSWTARKGVRVLAPALTAVLERRPDARASLLGTRAPRDVVLDAFPAWARQRIRVVPEYSRGELPALLADHEILASASLAEGFSLGLVEGMACGLVPVVTALPGARAVVRDGHNGVLVAPDNEAALTAALLGVADDPARRAALRRAAHATAQEYTWERVAEPQLALFAAALGG